MVRFVQTYSVFKQTAKSICNEYSICFSSQKLPYSSASVFVYGVLRTPLQHIKKPKVEKSTLDFLVRFVQAYSVIKIIAKAIINNHFICFSSQKPPYSGASVFVLWGSSPYNQKIKIAKQIFIYFAILVRWKGLEPPTYWFVASHSIQLSYQRICKCFSLAQITITHCTIKCKHFFANMLNNFYIIFADCLQ